MGSGLILGALLVEPPLEASVVTLGNFDGVHLGHQALARRTVEAATRARVLPVAYTFEPHPARVLAPKTAPPTLMSLDEKVRHLHGLGLSLVVAERFDPAFAAIAAEEWVERFLVDRLRPQRVVVGFNFTYGRDAAGDVAMLSRAGAGAGFDVEVIQPVAVEGATVSSTRIRALLAAGDVATAEVLLGRRYALTGRVAEGEKRGRTLGFPTANLELTHELVPKRGVYATRVEILGRPSSTHDAVTNIGLRPTFGGVRTSVESFLLDYAGDLYGRDLRVELVARLRDEQRFDGREALVRQIQIDVDSARRLFEGARPR